MDDINCLTFEMMCVINIDVMIYNRENENQIFK